MADTRSEADERLMQWLRDAHAMEKQAETMLSGMEGRIENYPKMRKRIAQHLRETEAQAERLEACIERLGGSTSTIKDMAARMTAFGQALSGNVLGDEIIKGTLASYTFEHFEIGSYRTLIAAAEALGDRETARVCRENLREEEEMAQWIEQNMAEVTAEYLDREVRGSERAKR